MGQLTPAQVTTSPRLLTMSLPLVFRGPYGHWSSVVPFLGTLGGGARRWGIGIASWCRGSRPWIGGGEAGTHDAHPDAAAHSAQGMVEDTLIAQ